MNYSVFLKCHRGFINVLVENQAHKCTGFCASSRNNSVKINNLYIYIANSILVAVSYDELSN